MTLLSVDPFTAARVLAAAFAERADEADHQGRLPADDIADLRASGLLTASIPRADGGLGLTLAECVALMLELAQGSASSAIVAGMHLHTYGNPLERGIWEGAARQKMLEIALTGGLVNSAASEPALGSPSRGQFFETTAEAVAGGWRIRGHKTWTTGGEHLTHLLVRLSLNDGPGAIIVPNHLPGIRWEHNWGESLSLRASDSHDVFFEGVVVPADHLVEAGKRDDKTPNAWFPLIMAAVYLGSALAARDAVIRFALERVPTALGKPIATLPKIQRQIGELDIQLQAARTFLLDATAQWRWDAQAAARYPRIAAAKHFATETANRVTDQAMQIAGGSSLTRDLPLERYFRDTRAGLMQPPAGDTALEIVGRGALGLS